MKKSSYLFLIILLGSLLIFSVNFLYNKSMPSIALGVSNKTYNVFESTGKPLAASNIISNRSKGRVNGLKLFLLERKIGNYVGKNKSRIGLVYYDFNSKSSIQINEDKVFYAASTVKVPLNLVYYNMAANKAIDLDEEISYSKSDYEGGTGIMQTFEKIEPTEIQTLLDYAIKYSDNIATNMLIKNIGYDNMKKNFDKIVGNVVDHNSNRTTSGEMIKYLKVLYENPGNNTNYKHLIEVMKETEFHDRLDRYVPSSVVAHKIGNYYRNVNGVGYNYVNDIGIIYTEKPYAIAIYTENLNNANEIIGEISKMIYDYQLKM